MAQAGTKLTSSGIEGLVMNAKADKQTAYDVLPGAPDDPLSSKTVMYHDICKMLAAHNCRQSGMSVAEIARQAEVSTRTVLRWLRTVRGDRNYGPA